MLEPKGVQAACRTSLRTQSMNRHLPEGRPELITEFRRQETEALRAFPSVFCLLTSIFSANDQTKEGQRIVIDF